MRRLAWIAVPAAAALAAPALALAVDWGPPEPVEAKHGIAEFRYYGEQVGVDAAGNAFIGNKATITTGDDEDEQALVLRRCAGTGWTPSLTAGSAAFLTHAHDLAVSKGGAAVVVWTDERHSQLFDLYASYRPVGGNWGAPEPIASGQISEIDVDVDDAGNAAVVWTVGSAVSRKVYAARRPAAGAWESGTELPGIFTGVLAMSGAGEIAVVGQFGLTGNGAFRAFVRPPGQPWPVSGEPVPTPPPGPGTNTGPSAVEYDGAGRLIVLDNENDDIESTVRVGGAWQPTQLLDEDLFPSGQVFDLARHPQGAVGAWREGSDLWVARFASGVWDTPRKFAANGSQYSTATAAADAAGRIVVAATRITPSGHEVWGAAVDGLGLAWPADTARLSPQAAGSRYYRDPAAGGGKYVVVAWTARDGANIASQAIASGPAVGCASAPPPPLPTPAPTPDPISTLPPQPFQQPKPLTRPKLSAFVKAPTCARSRKLKVTFKVPSGQRVARVELRVNGKRAVLRRAPRVKGSVTLKRLPKRFKLQTIVTFASGAPLKATRTVKACR